ncbi:hypothetical protein Tco_1332201 [Tanacetum coccineum]
MDSENEKGSLKRSGQTLQGAEKNKQKVLDVEDILIPEFAKFMKEEEIEVKQPVLKMSRRKLKARKGISLHTSTEPESAKKANQRDSVFVNFGAMLHNISRDDLVDLYKIMLQKTTAYGPEEDLERAFVENLRIMSYPLSEEVCRMMLKKKLFAQNTEVKKKLLLAYKRLIRSKTLDLHSSSDHSSSGHSILGHSLSRHASPDTTVADSSTPPRIVHPPLARTLRSGDSSSESSARPCHKRCRSLAAIVTSFIHATRALVPSRADLLPPRKRFRDSISFEDSVEEDIDTDVLEYIEADATAVEVVVDKDVVTGLMQLIPDTPDTILSTLAILWNTIGGFDMEGNQGLKLIDQKLVMIGRLRLKIGEHLNA